MFSAFDLFTSPSFCLLINSLSFKTHRRHHIPDKAIPISPTWVGRCFLLCVPIFGQLRLLQLLSHHVATTPASTSSNSHSPTSSMKPKRSQCSATKLHVFWYPVQFCFISLIGLHHQSLVSQLDHKFLWLEFPSCSYQVLCLRIVVY